MCAAKHPAYCPIHQTYVDLQQGFESCAVEHQCFSDDPCPLSEKFQAAEKIPVAARSKVPDSSATTEDSPRADSR